MKDNKVKLSEKELTEMMSRAILKRVADKVIYEENGVFKIKGHECQFNNLDEAFNHVKKIID